MMAKSIMIYHVVKFSWTTTTIKIYSQLLGQAINSKQTSEDSNYEYC